MQISHLNPSDLVFNSWNSNVVSPENEIKLQESIQRFGMFKPILVRTLKDGSYEIIGGQHRAEVAIKLGIEKIPAVVLGEIDDKKAKEISLVDNGRFGEDDHFKLAEILGDLGSIEELSSFTPYSLVDLNNIFTSSSIALDTLDEIDLSLEDLPTIEEKSTNVKTHSIMRFKVPLDDVDRITSIIERTIKQQGFTESDQLTNAGDALVHLLLKRDKS